MVAEKMLLGLTLEGRRHVAGRDRDHVLWAGATVFCGELAGVGDRIGDSAWSEEIDLDGLVERGVEGHGRCGVDHDVARRELTEAFVVEAEEF